MKVTYRKLWKVMDKRNIKRTDLRNLYGISAVTVDRLVNDKNVNTSTIVRLCEILKVQPKDIMEVVR